VRRTKMGKAGREVQVEMSWDLDTIKHDGRWYVTLDGKHIGAGLLTEEAATAVMKWVHTAIGDICDLISCGLEEYFKELEKP